MLSGHWTFNRVHFPSASYKVTGSSGIPGLVRQLHALWLQPGSGQLSGTGWCLFHCQQYCHEVAVINKRVEDLHRSIWWIDVLPKDSVISAQTQVWYQPPHQASASVSMWLGGLCRIHRCVSSDISHASVLEIKLQFSHRVKSSWEKCFVSTLWECPDFENVG